jgi:23S rRNA pseudouridine1911/1915/1917 synthase
VEHPVSPPLESQPPQIAEVLHAASGVLAVRKPAGLATQAPSRFDSMERRVRDLPVVRDGTGYLGVPHRLDRPVSGVLLLAITPRAARQLSRQFERRQVRKTYRALLEPRRCDATRITGEWQEWRDRLAKVPDEPRGRVVGPDEACPEARDATTRVRLRSMPDASRLGDAAVEVEFEPLTGRMHQLRIQSAVRGLPVLGDAVYGATLPFGEGSIALHASRIEFLDPDTKQPVVVECPPPW